MTTRIAGAAVLLLLSLAPVSMAADSLETGTVTIYRQSRVVARIYRSPIRIGDHPLLNLRNGSYWSAQLPPGKYTFTARDKDVFSDKDKNASTVEVDVRPGEKVYIRASLVMGGRKPNTTPTVVSAGEASSEMAGLKPVKGADVKHPDFQPREE